jgi:hypothetical protein
LWFDVGDGKNIHLWFDLWHPAGVLYEIYGHRVIYDACSKPEAWLSTVIRDGDWNWRLARPDSLVEIQSNLCLVNIGEEHIHLDWWKLIWFPLAIPKQAFITWLVVRDARTTGDKMLQWGYKAKVKMCVL